MTLWKQPRFINKSADCSTVQVCSVECLECLLTNCQHHLSGGCWSGSYTKYWGWHHTSQLPSCHLYKTGKLSAHEFEKKCWGWISDVAGDKSTFQTITWIRNVTKTQTMLCSSMGPPWICFNHLQIILVLVFYHILYNDNILAMPVWGEEVCIMGINFLLLPSHSIISPGFYKILILTPLTTLYCVCPSSLSEWVQASENYQVVH